MDAKERWLQGLSFSLEFGAKGKYSLTHKQCKIFFRHVTMLEGKLLPASCMHHACNIVFYILYIERQEGKNEGK